MKYSYIIILAIIFAYSNSAQSQCYPERHNTTWYDGWISCDMKESPNPDRGQSHWILYNLGDPYSLGKTKIWNSNHPESLDRGLREVMIDYSLDGQTWTEHGSFSLDQGTGLTTYEGQEGPDLTNVEAQYILITANSNYGNLCYGMSEISFSEAEGLFSTSTSSIDKKLHCLSVNVYPNPFEGSPNIDIKSNCNENTPIKVVDAIGSVIYQNKGHNTSNKFQHQAVFANLPAGIYFLHVGEDQNAMKYKLLKMK